MAVVSVKHLFEAGAHLGHKTQKWHPKMKEYIYGSKSGIYIIDLRQTLDKLKEAYEYVLNVSANGGKVLFVGTKYQARDIIKEEALRSNNFFVNLRWLGGMLTNFNTIKQSIVKLKKVEDIAGPDLDYVGVLKKEAVRMEKERRKLQNILGGITELRKKPAAVFIIDIKREFIALNEAKKLGIPIIAITDTNCDPRGIDYVIPGNDDSAHCITLFTSIIASAAIEGRKIYETKVQAVKLEQDKQRAEDKKKAAIAAKKKEALAAKKKEVKAKPAVQKLPKDDGQATDKPAVKSAEVVDEPTAKEAVVVEEPAAIAVEVVAEDAKVTEPVVEVAAVEETEKDVAKTEE
ncbi:MAG: 30S ribosomal protein S2 [Deltaproteobacteria bacterium]|jgi:small subunit ribosomal protein S2|nr:30S ribosomal protein S2 [Deltaproteobacteria bacterium]MBT4091068.1 30S ribosomal protein S2 [Deltaproteobacteria bacterium]MBT4263604.1 30S ribosomal protein S2 [Deltaproteobacteria bacterium]MBT4644317.1 30S ribosomal protein S2 [Deltaproteobacteria bacterium]MBT6500398.1 30S ribosomal protein S2 [Deltaproteobacteria bacterium]